MSGIAADEVQQERPMPVDAERVQAIFWEVVQVSDPAGRVAVLERECPAGGELRQRVEALLKAHDDAGAFLSEPPIVHPVRGR